MERLGKYGLLQRINTGGVAELFLASQSGPSGGKTVLIKRLHPSLARDPALVRTFVNEARVAARLRHPNIAQIYELGSVEDQYFISMEHVNGQSLADVQSRSTAMSEPVAHDLTHYILSRVCRALQYAHALTDQQGRPLGLVHRDVSPHNVLLSFAGEVKLVDFGLAGATAVAAEAQAGLLSGKYAYMSPEQCRNQKLDARSDIFAVGILLYELICHRRLFRRQSELATMKAVVQDPIPPPSAVSEDVPDHLEEIILRALARDPEDRFQSAGELLAELDQVAGEEGWRAGPLQAAEYLARLYPPIGARAPQDRISAGPGEVTLRSEGMVPKSAPRVPAFPVPGSGTTPPLPPIPRPPSVSPTLLQPGGQARPQREALVPLPIEGEPDAMELGPDDGLDDELDVTQAPARPEPPSLFAPVRAVLTGPPPPPPPPPSPRPSASRDWLIPDFTHEPTLAGEPAQGSEATLAAGPSAEAAAVIAAVQGMEPTMAAGPSPEAAAAIAAAQPETDPTVAARPSAAAAAAIAAAHGMEPTVAAGPSAEAAAAIAAAQPGLEPTLARTPTAEAAAAMAATQPIPVGTLLNLDEVPEPEASDLVLPTAAGRLLALSSGLMTPGSAPDPGVGIEMTSRVPALADGPEAGWLSRRRLLIYLIPVLLVLAAVAVVAALKLRDAASAGYPVEVVSEPAGASVYVDGEKRFGMTPLTVYGLTPEREHKLLVILEGFRPWQKALRLDGSDEPRRLQVRLERTGPGGGVAQLAVEVDVPGADVYLDGEKRGTAPLVIDRVRSGEAHVLVVKKEGYLDEQVRVPPLELGQKQKLRVKLRLPSLEPEADPEPRKPAPGKVQPKPAPGKDQVTLPRAGPRLRSPIEDKIGEHLPRPGGR